MPDYSHKTDWKNESIADARNRLRRKWGDYLLTILIINPINLRLARWIAKTNITPNQLTLFSFFLSVLSAFCMTTTARSVQFLGGILLLWAFQIDCLDGDLARLKGLRSPLGAMLDPLLDRVGEVAVIFGMAVGGWRATGNWVWLAGGIALVGSSQIYFYITDLMLNRIHQKNSETGPPVHFTLFGTRVRIGLIEPFIWGQSILAFLGIAYWGVAIFGIMFAGAGAAQLFRLVQRMKAMNEDADEFTPHSW